MHRLTLIKLVLAAIGIVIWGYGARADIANVRLAGMIVLGVALLLRLLPASLKDRIDGRPEETTDEPTETNS